MSGKMGRRMAENYEITQGIRIGDKEVVFGMDEKAELPYFCAFYTDNSIFGSYHECMAGDDYAEIMELFADRVKAQCQKVHEEQEKAAVPREIITERMCTPMFQCGDIAGKVMAVKAGVLRPEYRSAQYQLVYVTGGNGAREGSMGTACCCTVLYSGGHERWERYDLQGEVKPEFLPDWAKERLAKIQDRQTGKNIQNRERRQEVR